MYANLCKACLRLLYNVPTNLPAVQGNSLGIVEYTPESYLGSDLDLFFEVSLQSPSAPARVADSMTRLTSLLLLASDLSLTPLMV